ncbi:MAG: BTAD domain-containing putative transcriptional regulator, partial [Candidatus Limnocylindria bacterium]
MAAVQDFNYKVALASGLRELQAGRLRQAEQQFVYLCSKFPSAPGGYRGLAKVRMDQADQRGALGVLRDGAAKLAKAGEHAGVVSLLNEALQLDPLDLGAHRRLTAAYALAGQTDAAAHEYARFVRSLAATDPDGARRDMRYGLDTLGPAAALVAVAVELGFDVSGSTAPRASVAAVAATEPEVGADARGGPPAPVEAALDAAEDPLEADMRAAEYIAKGDPRAAQA